MKRCVYFLSLFLVVSLGITGCGYKPSAKYSRAVTGEKISTSVVISAKDPENTVIIKDAVDAAIVEIFHASLTSKNHSNTHLKLSISSPSYAPLQYNNEGYVVAYRATLNMQITRQTRNTTKKYRAKGTYDFAIDPNAIITDKQRFDAIKYASIKAIASFVSQVSAEGTRTQEE
jgi:hypothetical protein